MRNLLLLPLLYFLSSCGQEPQENEMVVRETPEALSYDTTAIDSFSPGATSVDVAAEIRRSSRLYQDSLQKIKDLAAQEELLSKAKATEAKKEAESKKASDAKTAKEANRAKSPAEEITPRTEL